MNNAQWLISDGIFDKFRTDIGNKIMDNCSSYIVKGARWDLNDAVRNAVSIPTEPNYDIFEYT